MNRSTAKVLHSPGRRWPRTLCRPSATRQCPASLLRLCFCEQFTFPKQPRTFYFLFATSWHLPLFLRHVRACSPCPVGGRPLISSIQTSCRPSCGRSRITCHVDVLVPPRTPSSLTSSAEICQPWIGCTGQLSRLPPHELF